MRTMYTELKGIYIYIYISSERVPLSLPVCRAVDVSALVFIARGEAGGNTVYKFLIDMFLFGGARAVLRQ